MPNILQKILTLVITVVVVYTLLKSNMSELIPLGSITNPPKTKEEISDQAKDFEKSMDGNFLERSISTIIGNVIKTDEGRQIFTNMVKPINSLTEQDGVSIKFGENKILNSLFSITKISPGEGLSACCGDKVKIYYKLYKPEGAESNNLEVILGKELNNNIIASLFVGMKKNSKITALVPKDVNNFNINELQNNQSGYIQIELNLIDIIHSEINPNEVKIFSDGFSYTLPVLCGDKIKFNLTIEDLAEKIFFSTESKKEKMEMRLGDSLTPAIFSYGIFNQTPSITKTIIAPAKYLRNFDKQFNLSNVKDSQYIVLKISDIENSEFNEQNSKNNQINKSNK